MVVRMRATRAHRDNRRSHDALKKLPISSCAKCKAPIMRHRACANCGSYAGRTVINFEAKAEKKAKKSKEKENSR